MLVLLLDWPQPSVTLFAAAPVCTIDTEKLLHVIGGFVFDLVGEFAPSVIAITTLRLLSELHFTPNRLATSLRSA
jgi:hypothetical protein